MKFKMLVGAFYTDIIIMDDPKTQQIAFTKNDEFGIWGIKAAPDLDMGAVHSKCEDIAGLMDKLSLSGIQNVQIISCLRENFRNTATDMLDFLNRIHSTLQRLKENHDKMKPSRTETYRTLYKPTTTDLRPHLEQLGKIPRQPDSPSMTSSPTLLTSEISSSDDEPIIFKKPALPRKKETKELVRSLDNPLLMGSSSAFFPATESSQSSSSSRYASESPQLSIPQSDAQKSSKKAEVPAPVVAPVPATLHAAPDGPRRK